MLSLDCHNTDSALTSLGTLLSIDRRRLRAALKSFSFSEFEASLIGSCYPPLQVLWNQIVGPGTAPPIPDLVCWFHATRVPPGTDFAEGIQNLGKFRSPELRRDVVEVALAYCYWTLWGQEQCIETNTCFDGGARSVPFSDIVQIEWPDVGSTGSEDPIRPWI